MLIIVSLTLITEGIEAYLRVEVVVIYPSSFVHCSLESVGNLGRAMVSPSPWPWARITASSSSN